MQAPYLGHRQIECLRLLGEAGKERSASQLAGKGHNEARRSLQALEARGLVVARWGWAGLMFCLTQEGHEALDDLT